MNLFDNIVVSEREDGCLDLVIRICDDGFNKNGKALDFSADGCLDSLVNQPLQGKIKDKDFTSHNLKRRYVKNENGDIVSETVLDTVSIGTFTETYVEEEDGIKYLCAKCVMWGNRYKEAKEIILNRVSKGELKGSWEVIPKTSVKATIRGKSGDLFTDYAIFGFCLLSEKTMPAYDSARVLEVAEEEIDELSVALANDINNLKEGGDVMENIEIIETEVSEEVVEDKVENVEENNVEESNVEEVKAEDTPMIDERDAEISQLKKELETVKTELSEKVDSIVKLGETLAEKDVTISEKDKVIAELEVFKETVAEIEKKKAEEELAKKRKACSEAALSSGYITESDIEVTNSYK